MRKTHPLEIAVVVICVLFFVWLFLPRWWFHHDGEQPPRAACLSNVKQLGLALKQYSYDFGDRYPWRAGAANPDEAWLDLGMLFPNYTSSSRCFFCPAGEDRPFELVCALGCKMDHPLEPLCCAGSREVISCAYCFDAGDPQKPTAWTENAHSSVRILADKKAGTVIGSAGNPTKMANHKDDGRNVLYQDGHVKWRPGAGALDPDEDDAAFGDPAATDYKAWWSDPPYHGE
jgi:prepilin-type processing-associated H-X9-DG protein